MNFATKEEIANFTGIIIDTRSIPEVEVATVENSINITYSGLVINNYIFNIYNTLIYYSFIFILSVHVLYQVQMMNF